MPHFTSYDGTEIAYRTLGEGPALVCLAGGPARDAAYLGDLGALDLSHRLVIPDSRGTGGTPPAQDPAAYAFTRLASRHAFHHLYAAKGCLGSFFGIWDRIMGTDRQWRAWRREQTHR